MQEEYRKIKGYENYSVSNFGVVRNDKKGRIFQQSFSTHGYKRVKLNDRKYHATHRLIAIAFIPNPENKPFIDHIDNDRANNSINNLRWVSREENSYNTSISKSNTSGVKGINWCKKYNKWEAKIQHKGKTYFLGHFTDIEEAKRVRQNKANELFGKFVNKCEKIVNLNIKIPKNTKLNININIEDDDEEYRMLEKELNDKINN